MNSFTKAKIDMWLGGLFTAFTVVPPYDWSNIAFAFIAVIWTLTANIDLDKYKK